MSGWTCCHARVARRRLPRVHCQGTPTATEANGVDAADQVGMTNGELLAHMPPSPRRAVRTVKQRTGGKGRRAVPIQHWLAWATTIVARRYGQPAVGLDPSDGNGAPTTANWRDLSFRTGGRSRASANADWRGTGRQPPRLYTRADAPLSSGSRVWSSVLNISRRWDRAALRPDLYLGVRSRAPRTMTIKQPPIPRIAAHSMPVADPRAGWNPGRSACFDTSAAGSHVEKITIELYDYRPEQSNKGWIEFGLKSIHYQEPVGGRPTGRSLPPMEITLELLLRMSALGQS